jgi:hypothetical protein
MPMNPQERSQHLKGLQTGATPDNVIVAKQLAKQIPDLVKIIRNCLKQINRQFDRLTGANPAAKQTALFDAISAETDGSLLLHDIAQILDGCATTVNTYRQPGEDEIVLSFTEADVDTYEA